MTARSLTIIWGIALAVVIGLTLVLNRAGTLEEEDRIRRYGAPVALIGSSLTREAVPWEQVEAGLLGDDRAHIRLALPRISERQSIKFLAGAITGGAETIFLEINAFSFDYDEELLKKAGQDTPIIVPTRFDFIEDFSERLGLGIQRLSGDVDAGYLITEHKKRFIEYDGIPNDYYEALYPIHLRDPDYGDPLKEQIDRARAVGRDVFFLSMPRSESIKSYMGGDAFDALIAHQQSIAADFGVPLFSPGPLWPNDHFRDMTHLNFRGRDRFIRELAAWYGARE